MDYNQIKQQIADLANTVTPAAIRPETVADILENLRDLVESNDIEEKDNIETLFNSISNINDKDQQQDKKILDILQEIERILTKDNSQDQKISEINNEINNIKKKDEEQDKTLEEHRTELDETNRKINDLHKNKASIDSYHVGMRVGLTDGVAATGSGDNVEYNEKFPVARMLAYAPDNTSMIGAVDPDDNFAPTYKSVDGDVVEGNQMVTNPNFANNAEGWNMTSYNIIDVTDGIIHLKVGKTNTSAGNSSLNWYQIYKSIPCRANDKILALAMAKGNAGEVMLIRSSSPVVLADEYQVMSHLYATPGNYEFNTYINRWANKYDEDTEVWYKNPSFLNLTTLFPTDQTWVNNLGVNDAQKVLHRLGFGSFNLDGAITENTDRTLQMGAEDIALVGYKEPTLDLANVGGFDLIDSSVPCDSRNGVAPRIKQRIRFSSQLKKAWGELKQQLIAKGIAIPTILDNPRLFRVNDSVGVKLYDDRVEVKSWMKVFDGRENWVKGRGDFYCDISAFAKASSNGQIAVISETNMKATSLNDKTDNTLSLDASGIMRATVVDKYDTVEEFRNYLYGKTYIFELAEPITIYFDERINLSFSDAEGTDIVGMVDIDGNPLYDVKVDGSTIDMRWNKTWVETNKQFPANVGDVLQHMGFKADYDTIYQMWLDVQSIKNR